MNHTDGLVLLQQMLEGTVECTLPKLTDAEMEDTGLFYREYFYYTF